MKFDRTTRVARVSAIVKTQESSTTHVLLTRIILDEVSSAPVSNFDDDSSFVPLLGGMMLHPNPVTHAEIVQRDSLQCILCAGCDVMSDRSLIDGAARVA